MAHLTFVIAHHGHSSPKGKLDSFLATQADRTLPAFTVLERLVDAANQA